MSASKKRSRALVFFSRFLDNAYSIPAAAQRDDFLCGLPTRAGIAFGKARRERSSKERRLIPPYQFSDLVPKTLQNSQILQPAERFSDVTGLCHHSVFGAKSAFSCQTSKVVPEPPSSLVFRRKPAPRVCRAPNSVFCPEKLANSSPLNSSPLVTALSPLAFWVQKCAKPGPVPELLFRRVSRGPTARRGPGSMSDSPPRWSVSPPSLSPLMSPLLRLRFFVQKALQTVESEESVFRVGLQVGCPSLQIRRFSVERRPLCSVFRFRAGKAANSSPPSMSPLVTANVTGL